MKNKLIDLNNHLFAQLERLGDEELKGDDLKSELERAKAGPGVAREVVNNGKLALAANKAMADGLISAPEVFGIDRRGCWQVCSVWVECYRRRHK